MSNAVAIVVMALLGALFAVALVGALAG